MLYILGLLYKGEVHKFLYYWLKYSLITHIHNLILYISHWNTKILVNFNCFAAFTIYNRMGVAKPLVLDVIGDKTVLSSGSQVYKILKSKLYPLTSQLVSGS